MRSKQKLDSTAKKILCRNPKPERNFNHIRILGRHSRETTQIIKKSDVYGISINK